MEPNTPHQPANAAQPPRAPFRVAFPLFAAALVLFSAGAAMALARWLKPSDERPAEKPVKFPARAFEDWKTKPDLVLAFTGQQMGYLLPCGCSRPQVGGLERRHNLFEMMRAAGWPVVPVDLGDVPQTQGIAGLPNQQAVIKYRFAMMSMLKMGYAGVGLGEAEAGLGLGPLLDSIINDKTPPLLSGNLMEAEKNFADPPKPWWYADVKSADLRVGVLSLVGPQVAARIKAVTNNSPLARFSETNATIAALWKQMDKGGVALPILLYQGPETRDAKKAATEATACAQAHPQFPIVAHLTEYDEPSLRPTLVKTKSGSISLVIGAGRKGKFVVVVGVWKTGKPDRPFDFKYERVEMTEDFMTPEGKEKDHPITALMEAYTKELQDKNYLERYGQVRHAVQTMPEVKGLRNPGKPTYVGDVWDKKSKSYVSACKKCHEDAHDVWLKKDKHGRSHSVAYKTLVDSKRPANRQYDPECIVCHTVGFGVESGFVSEAKTPHLMNVGCESCHGPSSLHYRNPDDKEWRRRINPWKYMPAGKREDAIDQMCQKCHDMDNDVHWIDKGDGKGGGFKRKWPFIEHTRAVAPEDKDEKDDKGEKDGKK